MVMRCIIFGCKKSGKEKSVSFHNFPKDENRNKVWKQKIQEEYSKAGIDQEFSPSKYSRICGNHFTLDCFDSSGERVYLKADAVPTVFNFVQKASYNCAPHITDTGNIHTAVLSNNAGSYIENKDINQTDALRSNAGLHTKMRNNDNSQAIFPNSDDDPKAELASIETDIQQIDSIIVTLATMKQRLLSKKFQIKQKLQENISEASTDQDQRSSETPHKNKENVEYVHIDSELVTPHKNKGNVEPVHTNNQPETPHKNKENMGPVHVDSESGISQTRKRRLAYIGDFNESDLGSPTKMKKFMDIVHDQIQSYQKIVRSARDENDYLKKKILKLENIISDLEQQLILKEASSDPLVIKVSASQTEMEKAEKTEENL